MNSVLNTGYSVKGTSTLTPEPREPNPTDRVQELIGYLNELEGVQRSTREKIFGPMPECVDTLNKIAHQPCLDELIAMACQKAACAASEARSLLNRL